ncbi:MAG TPA: hypothetical protein VGQ19_04645, partial [Burkholderiales bacterium]|nr:hypothetical protein [Burkholderiales bacterium]
MAGAELVLTGAHADDPSQLSSLKKAIQLLHVAAKTVVVADHNHSLRFLGRRENAVHTRSSERQWTLAQDVNLGQQR